MIGRGQTRGFGLVAAALLAIAPARAELTGAGMGTDPQSTLLREARLEQKLDAQIPLDLAFKNETGETVTLGSLLGQRPAVLVMAYYECPMLCTMVLNGLVKALNVINLQMGEDYDVITVSIDPRETPALAAAKKVSYVKEYRRGGAEAGWHFLTGDAAAIATLTDTVGFRYRYDEASKQFAHASGIMVVTPAGKLSKYFYGIEYSARDLRLGLVDAGQGRVGTTVDEVLLWCFHYDPVNGRYSVAVLNIMRIAAALTVAAMVAWVAMARRPRPPAAAGGATR